MKLAMIRRIAHHTSGEAKPLTPVQDNALSGSAISVAPRFKRSSETNTQITLNVSCSHGLPKPEGRSRIRLFNLPSCHGNRIRTSKLIGVWKSAQDWIVPRRPQIFDHSAEDRIQKRARVHD